MDDDADRRATVDGLRRARAGEGDAARRRTGGDDVGDVGKGDFAARGEGRERRAAVGARARERGGAVSTRASEARGATGDDAAGDRGVGRGD